MMMETETAKVEPMAEKAVEQPAPAPAPAEEPALIPETAVAETVEASPVPAVPVADAAIDYSAWDEAITAAISALPTADRKTRSQEFLGKHPTALQEFRSTIQKTDLAIPLAPFQQHPTYILRFLLAEWRDEELKTFRTDLNLIISKSLERVVATQKWRSGDDECWVKFGYKHMDDMYANFTYPQDKDDFVNKWFFQGFYGTDKSGHPVHYELLPDSYHEEYMDPLVIRRILNNEKTLRERVPRYNPPFGEATPEQLANPKLGVTWVLDARKISMWVVPAVYKTMTGMISYSNKFTSAHYPEQGYRAYVVNLGSVLVSLYNIAIKIMPAQTQRTTNCYGGREVLDEVVGEEEVPGMFKKGGYKNVQGLSEDERRRQVETGDAAPWIQVAA
ncbi:hypothetical protein H072_3387 [Dactylellina haptotyla CBS 200.50]|uniref:CRAL-TRIO domain-containing protein n=1 Tax=Dactylellina haptotyla (strain CBS 200.50) TaxID=1284197 RepID=S8AHS3_DACHA|nr:hypothetical protein H072_3387 [Dactylellina haptotyla CBS 200.50]